MSQLVVICFFINHSHLNFNQMLGFKSTSCALNKMYENVVLPFTLLYFHLSLSVMALLSESVAVKLFSSTFNDPNSFWKKCMH